MKNKFINYNDYELLYLINEGSQRALDVLFQKYDIYISKIAYKYFPYGDKRNDLIQEGRFILFTCIKSFKDSYNVSFFSYFSISLNRVLSKLVSTEYYSMLTLNEDISFKDLNGVSNSKANLYSGERLFKDKLLISLYNECVLGNLRLSYFAKKYNMSYSQVYYKYNQMISELKKMFE